MSKNYYLNDSHGTANRKIYIFDLAVLVFNLIVAARDSNIGYEDPDRTVDRLEKVVNKLASIKQHDLECLLYSSNLLDEKGKFFHPKKTKFKTFVQSILDKNERFDYEYNVIERKL
jgi:hypothetical protein